VSRPVTSNDDAFAMLVKAAVAGERCPKSHPTGRGTIKSALVTQLAHAGRIRVEIYFHNWRVIEILEGPHKGRRTQECPKPGAKPYLTIDKSGTHFRYGAPVTMASTSTPWGKRS
jgi:hypothetical protein